ncbi:MAG: DNA repair protein RadA [Candidatus Peregrinibacteria bacterium]
MKQSSAYRCSQCAASFPKWAGQCGACNAWNSLEEYFPEVTISKKTPLSSLPKKSFSTPEHSSFHDSRIPTNIEELDRVLGNGFFPDSLVLLTGDPGIGKSTLSLQVALSVSLQMPKKTVLILTGEESVPQVSSRLFRLSKNIPPNLKILSETVLESALAAMDQEEMGFLVVDSVQTLISLDLTGGSGSLSQTTAVVEQMMRFAKMRHVPVLLIGHVTKAGEMAGPQTLAHLVDVTLHLEGDRFHELRILRSGKNRFGSSNEMGVFQMEESGLVEVKNPSENFLQGRLKDAIGSAIFPSVEGNRSFLVEVQALTKWTNFGYPKRSASGVDVNRLGILLAVLARHAGVKLDSEDVFANIVGGIKVAEPALDMALLAAIISSKSKISLPSTTVFCGEVGLSGEIRNVSHLEKRLKEAEKLGFTVAVIPKSSPSVKLKNLKTILVATVGDLKKVVEGA